MLPDYKYGRAGGLTNSIYFRLICSFYYFDFFFSQAIQLIDAEVYFAVGLGYLFRELLAVVAVLVEVVFPFVLLREREVNLLLLQLSHEGLEFHLVECLQRRRYLHALEVFRKPTEETAALLLQLLV